MGHLTFCKLPIHFRNYFCNDYIKEKKNSLHQLIPKQKGKSFWKSNWLFSLLCIPGNSKLTDIVQLSWSQRSSKWIVTPLVTGGCIFTGVVGWEVHRSVSIPPHRAPECNRQPMPLEDLFLAGLGKSGCPGKEQCSPSHCLWWNG